MYDNQKIEDAVLALLGAFEFENGRVWKRFDFEVMLALAEKGLISDPRGRAESVHLTPRTAFSGPRRWRSSCSDAESRAGAYGANRSRSQPPSACSV